ncbi:MAG: TIGR01777 family oxidoreductase [Ferruginibacter sp.]
MMQTVVITGGTGMIGTALSSWLSKANYKIIIYTRNVGTHKPKGNITYASWDVEKKEIDEKPLLQADYIIHLAGAGVMDKRWSENFKKEIIKSRVESALLIINKLRTLPHHVKAIISASATGYYGPDKALPVFTEDASSADDFLGTTCRLWEESVLEARELNIRTVFLRTGIVLSKEGGALEAFRNPLKFGIAGIPGNGKQTCSWIHISDLCGMYVKALKDEKMTGPYNAVAPVPVPLQTVITNLAKKLNGNKFIILHAPAFFLKLLLGERSIEILKSVTVSSEKIEKEGYTFLFRKIDTCLDDLIKKGL